MQPGVVILTDPSPILLRSLLGHPRVECVPVVVITEATETMPAAAWLDLGADEVLEGTEPASAIAARLRRVLRHRAQLTELVRQNQALDLLASVDLLTNLPNRRRLDEQVRAMEAAATRRGEALGVLLMDLDQFKEVNDTYGHDAGDEVLREVAARLRGVVRIEDNVARLTAPAVGRWGGDEFIVATSNASMPDLSAIGERMIAAISTDPIRVCDHHTLKVTGSVGGASAIGEPWPELLRRADDALYRVKAGGGNGMGL